MVSFRRTYISVRLHSRRCTFSVVLCSVYVVVPPPVLFGWFRIDGKMEYIYIPAYSPPLLLRIFSQPRPVSRFSNVAIRFEHYTNVLRCVNGLRKPPLKLHSLPRLREPCLMERFDQCTLSHLSLSSRHEERGTILSTIVERRYRELLTSSLEICLTYQQVQTLTTHSSTRRHHGTVSGLIVALVRGKSVGSLMSSLTLGGVPLTQTGYGPLYRWERHDLIRYPSCRHEVVAQGQVLIFIYKLRSR